MAKWRITNIKSGQDLGVYEAETEQEALRAMMRDAGADNEEIEENVVVVLLAESIHSAIEVGCGKGKI